MPKLKDTKVHFQITKHKFRVQLSWDKTILSKSCPVYLIISGLHLRVCHFINHSICEPAVTMKHYFLYFTTLKN